jgi:hypothetical protein
MILPESPKALALDGTLAAWGTFVILKGVPALITLATLVLIVLRVMIAWRDWRRG